MTPSASSATHAPTPAPAVTAERFSVRARDGLALSVTEVSPRAATRDAPAVLLLHGLAAGGLGYDYPGRSLARWLAARGARCFVAELRGHGRSERPARPWSLDDYLAHDLPALLDALRARAGVDTVRWVGHSMGGILLLAYGSLHPDAPVARGVTVGSALDYHAGPSGFRDLLPLLRFERALGRGLLVPYGHLARAMAPLLARTSLWQPERFNLTPGNVEPEIVRGLYRDAFHSIPTPLLVQLAGLFSPEGLRVEGGRVRVSELAGRYVIPTTMVAGAGDEQVSVAAMRSTAARLGVPATVRVFSRATGHAADYGHWDLLVGTHAEREVWPTIADAVLSRDRGGESGQ